MIILHNEDCMDAMKRAPNSYWDLGIVDPPYGINMGKTQNWHRPSADIITQYKSKDWDSNVPTKEYWSELFRVTKNQIIFGANYFTPFLPPKKGWMVWDKKIGDNNFSMFELIYTSFKTVPKIISIRTYSNDVSNNREKAKQNVRIHPTQKPIPLYLKLLDKFSNDGDMILDTHLGSGSSALAAHQLGKRNFWGYEIDKEYFDAASKRLEQYQKQLRMF